MVRRPDNPALSLPSGGPHNLDDGRLNLVRTQVGEYRGPARPGWAPVGLREHIGESNGIFSPLRDWDVAPVKTPVLSLAVSFRSRRICHT